MTARFNKPNNFFCSISGSIMKRLFYHDRDDVYGSRERDEIYGSRDEIYGSREDYSRSQEKRIGKHIDFIYVSMYLALIR